MIGRVRAALRRWWTLRRCPHPLVRVVYGDERNTGALYRCTACAAPLRKRPPDAVIT